MAAARSSIVICLGANIPSKAGSPAETSRAAVAELADFGIFPKAISRFYATPCFPVGAGPDYVNAALRAETSAPPADVLAALHSIETKYGRNRQTRWGQRTLDLDLVAYGDRILPDIETHARWMDLPKDQQQLAAPDRLVLPHPRMQDRGFVLVPICDVDPSWRHPVLGRTADELRNALDPAELGSITPL